jgi:hypothetical protein
MTEQQILHAFKVNIIAFLDELIDQFPHETNIILARVFLKDQIPIQTTMQQFILKLESRDGLLRDMAKERNDKFFLENNIFSMSHDSSVNHFRKIWVSDLDNEDRETIWRWIDSFIQLAEKYQTVKRRSPP